MLDTIQAVETPQVGIVRRMRLRVAAVLGFLAFAVGIGSMGSANAAPPDPTGGAATSFLDDITDWVTTYGVPLVFGLLLLGVIIAVAIKYARKGARSV